MEPDWIKVAGMAVVYALYLLDQRRIARRIAVFADEARRKLRGL